MFVLKTIPRVAVRGRLPRFKPFTTSKPKYDDDEPTIRKELEMPAEGSVVGQVLKLKQDHEVLKGQLDHIQKTMENGFNDVKSGITRIDRWIVLLVGAFIVKGGFDNAKADGWFKNKDKVNEDIVKKDKAN